jgi:hypothetical protein
VHPGCLARSPNGVEEYCKTSTSDRDIIRRHWLPIDVDPVKPTGISATDCEVASARDVAREVYHWLIGKGWPAGVRASRSAWRWATRRTLRRRIARPRAAPSCTWTQPAPRGGWGTQTVWRPSTRRR